MGPAVRDEEDFSGTYSQMIDIHTHVIPGVDDGSQSMRESVIMLKMSMEQGFDHIIATPHFNRHLADRVDPYKYIEALKKKKDALQMEADKRLLTSPGHGLGNAGELSSYAKPFKLTLSLGQEIQYFEELPDFLDAGKALTLAGSRYVLVEFLPGDDYMRLKRAVHNLLQDSYLPVIAHVERYACMREKGRTRELKDMGAYLQINTLSLAGGFFDRNAAWCKKEILKGNIHFVATDMHGVRKRPPDSAAAVKWLCSEKAGGNLSERLFTSNPGHILADEML